jgi:hypothetical protein
LKEGIEFKIELHGIKTLPEEERTNVWGYGIVFYVIGTASTWMSLFLFYSSLMEYDILCTLARLGDDLIEQSLTME